MLTNETMSMLRECSANGDIEAANEMLRHGLRAECEETIRSALLRGASLPADGLPRCQAQEVALKSLVASVDVDEIGFLAHLLGPYWRKHNDQLSDEKICQCMRISGIDMQVSDLGHLRKSLAATNGRRRVRTLTLGPVLSTIIMARRLTHYCVDYTHGGSVGGSYKHNSSTSLVMVLRAPDHLSVGFGVSTGKSASPGSAWHMFWRHCWASPGSSDETQRRILKEWEQRHASITLRLVKRQSALSSKSPMVSSLARSSEEGSAEGVGVGVPEGVSGTME